MHNELKNDFYHCFLLKIFLTIHFFDVYLLRINKTNPIIIFPDGR